jgi:hypothetical protein
MGEAGEGHCRVRSLLTVAWQVWEGGGQSPGAWVPILPVSFLCLACIELQPRTGSWGG